MVEWVWHSSRSERRAIGSSRHLTRKCKRCWRSRPEKLKESRIDFTQSIKLRKKQPIAGTSTRMPLSLYQILLLAMKLHRTGRLLGQRRFRLSNRVTWCHHNKTPRRTRQRPRRAVRQVLLQEPQSIITQCQTGTLVISSLDAWMAFSVADPLQSLLSTLMARLARWRHFASLIRSRYRARSTRVAESALEHSMRRLAYVESTITCLGLVLTLKTRTDLHHVWFSQALTATSNNTIYKKTWRSGTLEPATPALSTNMPCS